MLDTYFWNHFSWLAKSGCQILKLAVKKFPPFPSFWGPEPVTDLHDWSPFSVLYMWLVAHYWTVHMAGGQVLSYTSNWLLGTLIYCIVLYIQMVARYTPYIRVVYKDYFSALHLFPAPPHSWIRMEGWALVLAVASFGLWQCCHNTRINVGWPA